MKLNIDKKFVIFTFIFLIVITLTWSFKTFYFVHELGLSPHKKYILFASGGVSLILISLLVITRTKWNALSAGLLYTSINLLFYADVVYERYYDSILHIELAGQATQVGSVLDSVVTLMYRSDFLYWIDLPFILGGFIWFNRKIAVARRPVHSTLFMGSGLAIILFTALFPLKATYTDQYMVSLTGILPAHIFSFAHTFYLDTLAGDVIGENSDTINELRSEFKENQALQKTSPYFGKFEGKNVIMVQAESLNTFPIGLKVEGMEITPNINKLISVSHYYPNTYLQIGRGNTSDAEFVANNSLYPMAPKGIYQGYPQNNFLSLGNILKDNGYKTSAAHGNDPTFWNREQAYKEQGYQFFYHSEHAMVEKDEIIGMGISDQSMFSQMVNFYQKEDAPFYSFIVTLSVHRPFELPIEYQYLDLPAEFIGTPTGHYLQSVHYFDKAVGRFIEDLKEKKLWDETIFVMYGDHYGPIPKDEQEIKELLNVTFDEKTQFNVPLIIHHPEENQGKVNKVVASQMDIYPTITSLLGIERPLIQFGKPLDIEHEGFAGFAYETTRNTYYSDRYDFIASHDGAFESGTCIDSNTNKSTDIEACRPLYNKLVKDIKTSSFLLENNLITSIFK